MEIRTKQKGGHYSQKVGLEITLAFLGPREDRKPNWASTCVQLFSKREGGKEIPPGRGLGTGG